MEGLKLHQSLIIGGQLTYQRISSNVLTQVHAWVANTTSPQVLVTLAMKASFVDSV